MARDVAGRWGPYLFGGLLCWNSYALSGRGETTGAVVALVMGLLILSRLGKPWRSI